MTDLQIPRPREVFDYREILRALRAFRRGDFSVRMPADLAGIDGEIAEAFNDIVRMNEALAGELARVCDQVGKEGKINQRARVPTASGSWVDCVDSVNTLIGALVQPISEVARVMGAVAKGDLSQTMVLEMDGQPLRGEFLRIGNVVNAMVDQLNAFASEVSRVAREVGTEGKLGGQAQVKGVAGTWKDLTDNVNTMAANLTGQVRNIAEVTTAVARGDLSKKITADVKGEILELKSTINTMVDQLNAFASEVSRVAREVGTEGKLGGQAQVPGVAGTWKDLTDNVNTMAANLTGQVRNIAEVTTAVARGDLSKKITADVKGEILELKSTINTMVDQLNAFASEVSRVAREVGTEGKLGGQAQVPGVAGTWKDLTDNVNLMAANLTGQVRGIANIVTAVANGDLDHKLMFEAKGEIAALADTINSMIDTLATFAEQVTNVAREVGVEGKLGGQAKVPGAAGLWRGLTDNVNQLAAHLTAQVRAIAEVATAVAQGDLTRSIMVDAHGEVAALKDNINEMIRNLADTTRKNIDQDWLKTNLANFSRTLQGHRSLVAASKLILTELAPLVNAQQGVVYAQNVENDEPRLDLLATYACNPGKNLPRTLRFHENLIGQCAFEKKRILLNDVPVDYLSVRSALGAAVPLSVVIMPVLFEGEVKAVVELASFRRFSETHLSFLDQLTGSIGITFNTIEATMRTERLLAQSQSLTAELQTKQEELQHTNQQLQENATQLSEQMTQVEYKGKEVELAKAALEEKAGQLALSLRYKSEFLANMSHELRTPLNSLLILAQMLAEDPAGNLTPKQIEFAQTIQAAGNDLLALINDVLDLVKIESGTVTLHFTTESFAELQDYLNRAFQQIGHDKDLQFRISMDRNLPPAIRTDARLLRQILKNLLSNAFKFTSAGAVSIEVAMVTSGWTPGHPVLDETREVVAFSVADTGIGIAADKQQIIFEAFRQADGTTSRHFGGTGLGLSISSSLAHLLGGEIKVRSALGRGSTFALYFPLVAGANGGSTHRAGGQALGDPDETPLLSRDVTADPARAQDELPPVIGKAMPELAGRKVLIVDDDIRGIFALTSALERQAMVVVHADNGADAIAMLASSPGIDIILMDMMMPGLDGYETIRIVRGLEQFRSVPIIGISARAMKGDRDKAIRAGASDYMSKPVDIVQLLSLIRARLAAWENPAAREQDTRPA